MTMHDDNNDDNDLSALDFFVSAEDPASDLDALTEADFPGNAVISSGLSDLVFSVTNLDQSVTVTAYLNGEIQRVDLTPHVVSMTETELAKEIVAVADVACDKARAAQYELVSTLLLAQGQDSSSIHELLERRMRLPTPDGAAAAEARLHHSDV